ncbi:CRISPR-associated protein Cas2 [Tetragenococcus halophilus]|uniref:CRISPR-associated endonuclease Cas2 n=1 Tax=Tetragenococcus halophilus TaxID=51669 RepID=UPI00083CDB31|nr:CRISPR-associated endonuclease Cas2 [Tetragenococcus halophilus]AOF48274.1 CRISPR-associated protein Cas2 [Tetragenococcus halophilus]
MMLLVCFDLPRTTRVERKQANKYQKKLVELGFTRKQFSLYEREIKQKKTREKVIEVLRTELPSTGMITLYLLPNEVNDKQITILGENAVKRTIRKPRVVFL